MTRQAIIDTLRAGNQRFDVVVVGGGITGAGVAREAAGSGLRTLLVEQKDFAWGTSSRSSKMVHGGLRYLGSGQYSLTRDAVRERQRLMAEAPGLIEPLPFIMPHYRKQFPGPALFQLLLRVYDRLAGFQSRIRLSPTEASQWVPGLACENLQAASGFTDAVTDDARLVQRVIEEAQRDGALCLNYVKATDIQRTDGKVSGIQLQPENESEQIHVETPLVINATGAWAGQLQDSASGTMTIRPLRGSHLVVPWQRLPVSCSVSLFHPDDGRPVFAFPWAGTTVLGTTDLDHQGDLSTEPCISEQEVEYLLKIAGRLFPGSGLCESDVISTWAGVRPVVTDGSGKAPSKENREHEIRADNGLISIAGGKLTTFRLIAREALADGISQDGSHTLRENDLPIFAPPADLERPELIGHQTWNRLRGQYGPDLQELLTHSDEQDLATIPGTDLLWAEVGWACRMESVQHLDDLMLRRTRLGLILRDGGRALMPSIQAVCQPALGWSDHQWQQEANRYFDIHEAAYSLPHRRAANGC